MGYREQWDRLSGWEKVFVGTHPLAVGPIKESAAAAKKETFKRFRRQGDGDESDAFRHCFWSAYLARSIGYHQAYLFTTAHEAKSPNDPASKAMDLHNNGVGLRIGWNALCLFDPARGCVSGEEANRRLGDMCMEALRDGRLKFLHSWGMPPR